VIEIGTRTRDRTALCRLDYPLCWLCCLAPPAHYAAGTGRQPKGVDCTVLPRDPSGPPSWSVGSVGRSSPNNGRIRPGLVDLSRHCTFDHDTARAVRRSPQGTNICCPPEGQLRVEPPDTETGCTTCIIWANPHNPPWLHVRWFAVVACVGCGFEYFRFSTSKRTA
jgi:hypothetical protein